MASIEQLKTKLTKIFASRLDEIFRKAGTPGSLAPKQAWEAVATAMTALKAGVINPPGADVCCQIIDPATGTNHTIGGVTLGECTQQPPDGLGGNVVPCP
jgi:hypothetical protein